VKGRGELKTTSFQIKQPSRFYFGELKTQRLEGYVPSRMTYSDQSSYEENKIE